MTNDVLVRAGPHLHPARRPRAERLDLDGAPVRLVGHQPVRGHRRRRGLPVGPGARRRQRGGAEHAGRDPAQRRRREGRRVHQAGEGQELQRQADGLRPPRLQELRPARQADARDLPRGADRAGPAQRPAVQAGDGAGEDRAGRRVLRRPQALPERRLLLRHRAARHRHPGAAVHRDLRAGPHGRLDRPAQRDDRRPRVQDRPSAPALRRLGAARRAPCTTRSGTSTSSTPRKTAPRCSTSTATWCTRSPARRPSRACAWPAASPGA